MEEFLGLKFANNLFWRLCSSFSFYKRMVFVGSKEDLTILGPDGSRKKISGRVVENFFIENFRFSQN